MTTETLQPAPASADELGGVLRDYLEIAGRLQQTHETLQREVNRLREELASKDKELERRRRLSALGELAAGVAHEVRNPLGAIQLYSDLLRKECTRCEFTPALALLERIDVGIRAIDGVVQDTLSLAPRSRELATHVLAELVERARDAVGPTFAKLRVRLDVRIEDADATVLADAAGLMRVLINLFTNAAEASSPDGTVSVTLASPAGGFVALCVRDDGPGLPDELLDRIFDPFFTTKENGTGLGLSIAHRLIEAFGGQLSARNRPTGGAEFLVQLRDGRNTADAPVDPITRQTNAA